MRTYGCQMNEHDSERIAGLLEADGFVPAASEDVRGDPHNPERNSNHKDD